MEEVHLMEAFRGGRTRKHAALIFTMTMIIGLLAALTGASPSASAAPMPGTVFDASDASPTGDVANGALDIPDLVGNVDTSNYGGGSKEDDTCPTIQTGTASPKDDLDHFYVGSESNATGVFLYVGWHRVSVTGTTTIDFELNHNTGALQNCNSVNVARTEGDLLITYDFQGTGPFTIDISVREWVGTSTSGHWSDPLPLVSAAFQKSISADGSFGELVVNLTLAGLMGTDGCHSFATIMPKTRSSSTSFVSSIKDFVPPHSVTVSNCGAVKVHKQDDAGTAMKDVQFDLYTSVNGVVGVPVVPAQSCITAANGDCTISDVFPGSYFLVEHAVPTGYTGEAPKAVAVTVGQTATVTFVNTRQPGTINIVKEDDDGHALEGATFALYTDNNGAIGTAVAGKTCTTNSLGQCSITNILPAGDYWVRETVTPAGYDTADDQQAAVTQGGTITLYFFNPRQPAQVDIVKTDDDDAALEGATFALYTDNNGAIGTAVSGKTCTTNSLGKCSITNILPAGDYWVRETVTPTGYETAPDQAVSLELNQTVTLTFVDVRQPATINIIKTDGTNALQGAVFTLYSGGQAVAGKSCTTNAQGLCSIGGILPPGEYTVKETTTPAGYKTAPDQTVNLDLNETITLTFVDPIKSISMSLVKTVNGEHSTEADPLLVEGGTVVDYLVTITNTGESALTISDLADTLKADLPLSCEQGNGSTLEPGDSFTCTYSTAITADAHNVASVTGTDVLGRTTSANDEVFVEPINPAIAVVKSGPSAAHVDDVVTYTFTVTNPGDTGLSNVTVTDDRCAEAPALQSMAGGNEDDVLEPGETWTYTCAYTVTEADGAAVENTVDVAGTDVLDTTVTTTDTFTFPVLHPGITIDKTANPISVTGSGPVTYTYVVKNVGDTTLFDIAVTDDILGPIGTIDSLAPGESTTLTKTVTVDTTTPATNVGTATGADVLGRKVTAKDSATISVVLGAVFVRPAELPRTGASVGRELTWALTMLLIGLGLVVATRRRRAGRITAD
jgi:hypothetical protein